MKMKYFDVHVFYSRKDGFSVFVKTTKDTEEEVIEEAIKQKLIDSEDAKHVDYVEEISKAEYKRVQSV